MLLHILLEILYDWQTAFPRQRSYRRAVAQALGTLTALGRRTLSRAIWAQGHEQQDWSAAYKLHARASWRTADLFQPVLARALPSYGPETRTCSSWPSRNARNVVVTSSLVIRLSD